MPLNNVERTKIKDEIRKFFFGDPSLPQEVFYSHDIQIKFKNISINMIDIVIKEVSSTTPAGDTDGIMTKLRHLYEGSSLPKELCVSFDGGFQTLIEWLRVTEEITDIFKDKNSRFKREEVSKYVKEILTECRDILISTQNSEPVERPVFSDTEISINFQLSISKHLGFQKKDIQSVREAELEKLPPINRFLVGYLDEFQLLSKKLNEKSDLNNLKDVYLKIKNSCVLIVKSAKEKEREKALYHSAINLEYAIRYYSILFEAKEKNLPVDSLYEQYIQVLNAIRLINEINDRFNWNHDIVFNLSYKRLLPPKVSSYLFPFIPEIKNKDTLVELPDRQEVSLKDETKVETFIQALRELINYFSKYRTMNPIILDFLTANIVTHEKKFALIQSAADEDDLYFESLIKTPLWQRLDFKTEFKEYHQKKSIKESMVAYIVHLREIALGKVSKNISLDKAYSSIFSVMDDIVRLLPRDENKKLSFDATQSNYIAYLTLQIIAAGEHYCKKANLALNLGVQGFMESYEQLKRSLQYLSMLPTTTTSPRLMKDLLDHVNEVEKKIDEYKFGRNKNLEKLQKEEEKAEKRKITFYSKRILNNAPEKEPDKKNDADETTLVIVEKNSMSLLDPEQACLNKIGRLLSERTFKIALDLLPDAKKIIHSPQYEVDLHILEAEAYRLEAETLLNKLNLLSHINKPHATPITEQEAEDIQAITSYLEQALFACKAVKQEKYRSILSEEIQTSCDMVNDVIRGKLNEFKASLLNFHNVCEYRKSLIKAANKWGHNDSGFSKFLPKLNTLTRALVTIEKNAARENTKLLHPDFSMLITPTIKDALISLQSKGLIVIMYGGYIRDKVHGMVNPTNVDAILIKKSGKEHESLLKQVFGNLNVKENPQGNNRYQAFFSGVKFDLTFEESASAEDVQQQLAEKADCYANSLSMRIDENGFHPIFDLSGYGINDARDGILDTTDFDKKITEDPFRLLRYLHLIMNKKFAVPEYFLTLDDKKKGHYNALLMNRCREKNEWNRLRTALNKLFSHGYAENTLQLLVNYRFLEVFFPKFYDRLKDIKSEAEIRAQLRNMDYRHSQHEVFETDKLSNLLGEMTMTPPSNTVEHPSLTTQTLFMKPLDKTQNTLEKKKKGLKLG